MPRINIAEAHGTAFEAVTNGHQGNFARFKRVMRDEPIVITANPPDDKDGEIERRIKPVLGSIVDGLVVTHHDGREL